MQPRLRTVDRRKRRRISILVLEQPPKTLWFSALSPPMSQMSAETEAQDVMKGSSRSGLEWRLEPDLPNTEQGSFLAAPTSTAAALNVRLTFSLWVSPAAHRPLLLWLCSPLDHFHPVSLGYVASQSLRRLHN